MFLGIGSVLAISMGFLSLSPALLIMGFAFGMLFIIEAQEFLEWNLNACGRLP